jgi:hypothetical protein
VLNEIAWSPGDPGTGAPSFLGIGTVGVQRAVSISQTSVAQHPIALFCASPHMVAAATLRGECKLPPLSGGRPERDGLWIYVESPSRSRLWVEHDLFGKPVSTFPDHALSCDVRE